MVSPLQAFLARNSVAAAGGLPLVHTTKSYNINVLIDEDTLVPQTCDVFTNEKLNYFFVGRPAYKHSSDVAQAAHWELPCCFIFEADVVQNIKRAFPFDSGAFAAGRYPSYIRGIPMDRFEAQSTDTAGKLIGAFFGTAERYMKFKPKSTDAFDTEYSINALDAELSATMRLAHEASSTSFDDRRFTIEIQSEDPVSLSDVKPIAVVLPELYLDIEKVRDTIQNSWGAVPIGYSIAPLSLAMYYSQIYAAVEQFYRTNGYL